MADALSTLADDPRSPLMVRMAGSTRAGFKAGDVSIAVSPCSVIACAGNAQIFDDLEEAFETPFINRCEEDEAEVLRILSEMLPKKSGQHQIQLNSGIILNRIKK